MREVQDLDSGKKVRKNKKKTGDHVPSKGTVTLSYRVFFLICIMFLMLPVLIFCLGYLRPLIGITLAVAFAGMTAISVMECMKAPDGTELEKSTGDILIPVKYLIVFAVAAVAVSLITGVGEYVYTLQDHPYRRAILNDLVNYKWPVIYNYDTQTNPEVIKIFGLVSGERAFSYYFVYWLPAAVIGKLLGIGAANIALLIWNSTGDPWLHSDVRREQTLFVCDAVPLCIFCRTGCHTQHCLSVYRLRCVALARGLCSGNGICRQFH